jgi:hypothetical protein
MKRSALAVLFCLVCIFSLSAMEPLGSRALVLVDASIYPELEEELKTYGELIRKEFGVLVIPRPDAYYAMKPHQIRELLRVDYESGELPLVGAIMAGTIPHALKTHDPEEILIPCPLYYEDFQADWIDENEDGFFEKIGTDRVANPTEIWTAWWVPPTMDEKEHAPHLKRFIQKLITYHQGGLSGQDQFLWGAGDVIKVETIEGWTVLLKDAMKPLDQELLIWSRIGQDTGTFRPHKRKQEFGPRDFETVFTLKPWQHAHVLAHGNQRGWYWDNTGVVLARGDQGASEYSLLLDLAKYENAGAQIITTSGCSNGNFRGAYVGPAYDRALPNLLLFSPHTNTVAFYGAASPQSTSGFPCMATELIEGLKSDQESYLGEGYFKMRNHDYSWGLSHFFFRGGDEKILNGDPFARYRENKPMDEAEKARVQERVDKMKWERAGPW